MEVKKGGNEKNCNKKLEVKKRLEVKEKVWSQVKSLEVKKRVGSEIKSGK